MHKPKIQGTNSYAKILLCRLHGNRELFLILWPPRVSSRIHWHYGDGCVHKLLQGVLKETLYIGGEREGQINTITPEDGSVFICDDMGSHKVCINLGLLIDVAAVIVYHTF